MFSAAVRVVSVLVALLGVVACGSSTEMSPVPPESPAADPHLRASLAASMSAHGYVDYFSRDTWRVLTEGAETSPGMIRLFYTRREAAAADSATGENRGAPDHWEREHVWPQSYGLRGSLARSDLHNLVPADASVNGSRSNKFFDDVTERHHECLLCGVSAKAWEPPPVVQGDVARITMYMDTRYAGEGSFPDLVLVDEPDAALAHFGRLGTLARWHCSDPVSAEELQRHEAVARAQGNRNAYVDAPELAEEVYGFACLPSDP